MRCQMARCMSAWMAVMSAAGSRVGLRRSRARAWSHSIAMAGTRIPPDAASLTSRPWTTSRVPGSSTRCAHRGCSRSSGLSSCQTAQTLRRLQQNIAPEAEHVLDWHHVTMRLTVLGQMIKGAWADAVTVETKAADLERIKWLLWHGNAPDAIDDIECL